MQMLRRQCDVERAGLAKEELGLGADALGQKLVAAAQAAAALHMAEQARRSLLSTTDAVNVLWKAGAVGGSQSGGSL